MGEMPTMGETEEKPMTTARVRVEDDLWYEVRIAAARKRQSIQEYVADALRSAVRGSPAASSTSQMAGR